MIYHSLLLLFLTEIFANPIVFSSNISHVKQEKLAHYENQNITSVMSGYDPNIESTDSSSDDDYLVGIANAKMNSITTSLYFKFLQQQRNKDMAYETRDYDEDECEDEYESENTYKRYPIFKRPVVFLDNDKGTIIGKSNHGVEEFSGIPFAEPPIGSRRFRHPIPYNSTYNNFKAIHTGPSCMAVHPINFSENASKASDSIPPFIKSLYVDYYLPSVMSEDCLHLNIYRPKGTTKNDKLPIIIFLYGGGFQFGSSNLYPGGKFITESVDMNHPTIFVVINYRLGPWGFLGGKGILKEGSANAGLFDQRLAMEWISDNIQAFGGDPNRITLMGESAGAISIVHHLISNNGDLSYKDKQLFHAVILQSGGAWNFDSITSNFAQSIFYLLALNSRCTTKYAKKDDEILECLRKLDTKELHNAQKYNLDKSNVFPWRAVFGWSPRYDGEFIKDNPAKLISEGKFAKLPTITGNQEDEGTFLTHLFNCKSNEDINKIMKTIFHNATTQEYEALVQLYPHGNPDYESPHRTEGQDESYPGYKRFAAMIGDLIFHAPRRMQLREMPPNVPCYVYHSTSLHNILPKLGTAHSSELCFEFYLNIGPSKTYRRHFISFANHDDPNIGTNLTLWKPYTQEGKETLEIGKHHNDNHITRDEFPRDNSIEYIMKHPEAVVI